MRIDLDPDDVARIADAVAARCALPPNLAWSPKELGAALGVSDDLILGLCARGELDSFRIGRFVRIPDEAARRWIERATADEMRRFAAPVGLRTRKTA